MMPWIIESYVGVNDLRFGMRPAQIASLAGQPRKTRVESVGKTTEFRELGNPIIHYREGVASEFIFSKYTRDLEFRGMKVFLETQMEVLNRLTSLAPDLLEAGGTMFSNLLGISLSGFLDPDDSNKSFGAFRRGIWDKDITDSKPVKI